MFWGRTDVFLLFEVECCRLLVDEAHSRKAVENGLHALSAFELVVPVAVAVHFLQHGLPIGPRQYCFGFSRESSGFFKSPERMNACVNEDGVFCFDHDGLISQPFDEFISVGCFKDFSDRVLFVNFACTGRNGEKMEVVVPEQTAGTAAKTNDAAKRRKRFGTAVDEISEKNKRSVFRELLEKTVQAFETALQVADGEVLGRVHKNL